MSFVEVFRVSYSEPMHEFLDSALGQLFEDEMVVIWVEAIGHKAHQFLFGLIFFFSVSKKVFVYTADRIKRIEFVHALKKSLSVQLIAKDFPLVYPAIKNVIIFFFDQLRLSHN